ncbi:hypothetical protein FQZ97_788620 [compost metagenome]
MRILVDLDGALAPLASLNRQLGAHATWIKDVDYCFKPKVIFIEKRSEFGFKLNFALKFCIVLEAVQHSKLFCQLCFQAFKFSQFAHCVLPSVMRINIEVDLGCN